MRTSLDSIRTPRRVSLPRQTLFTAGIFLLAFGLGVFAKYLDHRQAYLPALLSVLDRALDLHNFLSGLAPWLLGALAISLYSASPKRAAVNVFTFFAAMLGGYYIYCYFAAGFFPLRYVLIWCGLTLLSPVLTCICWYALGKGRAVCLLAGGILAVFFNCAFAFGWVYLSLRSVLDFFCLLGAAVMLRRPARELPLTLGAAILFAVVLRAVCPFFF